MRRAWRRSVAVIAGFGIGLSVWGMPSVTAAATAQEVAAVEQLKIEAFKALRGGQFDRTNELLSRAASLSHDPQVEQWAQWTTGFQSQLDTFTQERHKQFKELEDQVKLLLKNDKPDYAMDIASRAYLLADDKKQFRAEGWVDELIKASVQRAEQDDKDEQWIKSLRLYSDLSAMEQSSPQWKEKLKLATRRVRLLALYTPDVLKHMQDAESKERETVEQLLRPTTQPATQPAKKVEKDNDAFRIDWHETLKGINIDMLKEALSDAEQNYYKQTSYKDMAIGGLTGVKALATTKGLEKAFPRLADAAQRDKFIHQVDDLIAVNRKARPSNQALVLKGSLDKLLAVDEQTVQVPEQVLISEFADGAFEKLDPFTSMIWPSDVEEFNKQTQGEFGGVGIQIQSDEDGSLKVATPLEDTPAYRVGIKPGDIITHIDHKSAKGISLNQAVKTITGTPGTSVTLLIKSPDGGEKEYTIKRELIHVASVKGWLHKNGGGWNFFIDPQQKIAYVRMTNFTRETPLELNKAWDQMRQEGARGMILDLRYNPGGLLTSATAVADKFLPEGKVIVSTRPDRDTGNQPTVEMSKNDAADVPSTVPLVVLVNQYSASASEIVSGALKDDGRAKIIGERTFGKGSVQMLFPLENHTSYLKLTTSHYYLPSGRCIHREENSSEWGVDPDVTVEMTPDQMRAAIDARQDLDILRNTATPQPAEGKQPKLDKATETGAKEGDKKPKKELLASDPQLSAAVLWLRLQLSGAQLES